MEDEAINEFFWDRFRDTTVGRYLYRHELAFVTNFLRRDAPPSVLDVSCGSGRITLPVMQSGLNVVGMDISPTALMALRRASDVVPLVRGDAHCLPFVDNRFHCVLAIQCVGDIDYGQFLRESCRVLRPNGLLLFSMVNRRSYKRAVRRAVRLRGTVSPSQNISCDEALQLAVDCGLTIEGVRGYNWIPFDRRSDSSFVGVAALLERWLGLQDWPRFSPWILVAARKNSGI